MTSTLTNSAQGHPASCADSRATLPGDAGGAVIGLAALPSSGPLRGPLRKKESHQWARHPEDWYVEPRWVSERLFQAERFDGHIHDPACGMGNIFESAKAAGFHVTGSDVVARRPDVTVWNWLDPSSVLMDNIVSNPPFGLCDDRKNRRFPFAEACLKRAKRKVVLLMPANWVQGDMRSRWLETTPLRRVWFISPRPSMPPGPALQAGVKPGNGTTDYAWFVWDHDYDGRPEVRWLRKDARP